jgi:hypothetical protein
VKKKTQVYYTGCSYVAELLFLLQGDSAYPKNGSADVGTSTTECCLDTATGSVDLRDVMCPAMQSNETMGEVGFNKQKWGSLTSDAGFYSKKEISLCMSIGCRLCVCGGGGGGGLNKVANIPR